VVSRFIFLRWGLGAFFSAWRIAGIRPLRVFEADRTLLFKRVTKVLSREVSRSSAQRRSSGDEGALPKVSVRIADPYPARTRQTEAD
jgi:hypothetical protein